MKNYTQDVDFKIALLHVISETKLIIKYLRAAKLVMLIFKHTQYLQLETFFHEKKYFIKKQFCDILRLYR